MKASTYGNVTVDMVQYILSELPERKREILDKALYRNALLTSSWNLSQGEFRIYNEGWYLSLDGTRCGFAVFAYDRDGELEFPKRKPKESTLHLLGIDSLRCSECDFEEFISR